MTFVLHPFLYSLQLKKQKKMKNTGTKRLIISKKKIIMKEKEKKTHFMLATIFLKHCCKGPCGSLVEEGITYFGVVVAQIPDVDSAESCASLCKEEVKCLFWTFKIIKQLCKLKSSHTRTESNDNKISGLKPCE